MRFCPMCAQRTFLTKDNKCFLCGWNFRDNVNRGRWKFKSCADCFVAPTQGNVLKCIPEIEGRCKKIEDYYYLGYSEEDLNKIQSSARGEKNA